MRTVWNGMPTEEAEAAPQKLEQLDRGNSKHPAIHMRVHKDR